MRIAQIAPPFRALPPQRYGGTERVVATLTDALVERGHDVTLFASGDSRTSARLEPTVPRALWDTADGATDFAQFCAATIGAVVARLQDFDLIHNHLDFWGYPLAALSSVPVLTTLHGRLDVPGVAAALEPYATVPLVSISDAQRRPVPWANFRATVYHGMDLSARPPRYDGAGGYLAWIGRIAPEKGLDVAIRVARRAHRRIRVAAREPLRFTADAEATRDRHYFEDVIQPLLKEPHVDYLGELGGATKHAFLRGADALLFPVDWPEPFGLVMIEALAAGTPVIALNRGSVPEVITHGMTGYVCADESELVDSVDQLGRLDRASCRAAVEARFSVETMVEAYESLYARLLGRQELIDFLSRARQRTALRSASRLRAATRVLESDQVNP